MKHQWICKHTEGARRVLLFFNGWGEERQETAQFSFPPDPHMVVFSFSPN